jgi:polyhydroxyalkanoate synthesis repressor PhaR
LYRQVKKAFSEDLMHHIKKYANRKLYDSTDKKYISMNRLAELLKQGEDIVIIDNETGKDITASIVSSLIARTKDQAEETVSSGMLIRFFRKGGATLTDYTKKYTSLWQKSFTMAEDELDSFVKKLVKDKEISKSEGSRIRADIIGFTKAMKTWISKTIDRRITEVLNVMNLATRDHVNQLETRLSLLEEKLKTLELLQQSSNKK